MLSTHYQYISFKPRKYKDGKDYNGGSTTFNGRELQAILAEASAKYPNGFNMTLSWDNDRVSTNKNGGLGVSGRISCYEPTKK